MGEYLTRLIILFVLTAGALNFPAVTIAADDLSTKWSEENLGKLGTQIIDGGKNLSAEEREEIVEYSTRADISEDLRGGLVQILRLSMLKADNRGKEAIRYTSRLQKHRERFKDPELKLLCDAIMVYAVEDVDKGDALEEEWFARIDKEAKERRADLIGILGNTKWISFAKRLERLKKVYESDKSSEDARIAVIDSVFGGMFTAQIDVSTGCDFYADLTLSTWTSPQLNRAMFQRLGELADFGRMLKEAKKN